MSASRLPDVPTDFQVISSIRCDENLQGLRTNSELGRNPEQPCIYYMLRYHRDRMLAAATEFSWSKACRALDGEKGLMFLEQILNEHVKSQSSSIPPAEPMQLRILLSSAGEINLSSTVTPPLNPAVFFPSTLFQPPSLSTFPTRWRALLSLVPVAPTPYTKHKTNLRTPYDLARSRLPASAPGSRAVSVVDEALLINEAGEIMEGSITTPYFFREGRWVTPAARCGGNLGTTRRWALETGMCVEGVVKGKEIRDKEEIWVSNGVRGFGWGRVELEPSRGT
ncbi:MAG: hypothetical protein FRX48_02437 [Lasallia pustulata]|uniref:Aminotransferase, class IV n=1 Tax=Lasallia pustulata TaxID=136370 RepID=A0A5M8PWR0_9LECA|nr:MAG: hypothetical protein FRX48_02437 [Lasallia pustulata]